MCQAPHVCGVQVLILFELRSYHRKQGRAPKSPATFPGCSPPTSTVPHLPFSLSPILPSPCWLSLIIDELLLAYHAPDRFKLSTPETLNEGQDAPPLRLFLHQAQSDSHVQFRIAASAPRSRPSLARQKHTPRLCCSVLPRRLFPLCSRNTEMGRVVLLVSRTITWRLARWPADWRGMCSRANHMYAVDNDTDVSCTSS